MNILDIGTGSGNSLPLVLTSSIICLQSSLAGVRLAEQLTMQDYTPQGAIQEDSLSQSETVQQIFVQRRRSGLCLQC